MTPEIPQTFASMDAGPRVGPGDSGSLWDEGGGASDFAVSAPTPAQPSAPRPTEAMAAQSPSTAQPVPSRPAAAPCDTDNIKKTINADPRAVVADQQPMAKLRLWQAEIRDSQPITDPEGAARAAHVLLSRCEDPVEMGKLGRQIAYWESPVAKQHALVQSRLLRVKQDEIRKAFAGDPIEVRLLILSELEAADLADEKAFFESHRVPHKPTEVTRRYARYRGELLELRKGLSAEFPHPVMCHCPHGEELNHCLQVLGSVC